MTVTFVDGGTRRWWGEDWMLSKFVVFFGGLHNLSANDLCCSLTWTIWYVDK